MFGTDLNLICQPLLVIQCRAVDIARVDRRRKELLPRRNDESRLAVDCRTEKDFRHSLALRSEQLSVGWVVVRLVGCDCSVFAVFSNRFHHIGLRCRNQVPRCCHSCGFIFVLFFCLHYNSIAACGFGDSRQHHFLYIFLNSIHVTAVVTVQFADKPTGGYSSRRLVNSPTEQFVDQSTLQNVWPKICGKKSPSV